MICVACEKKLDSFPPRFLGDDSSNEDQGREADEAENREEAEMAAAAQPGDMDDDGNDEDSGVEDETNSDQFSFPDTTISLSHLQPIR